MKVLIVHAHPEPQSFGAALRDRALQTLSGAGHAVQVSDLYAMDFEPVARGSDFTQRRFADKLQYDREQKFAAAHDAFAPDIQAEIDKLLWSDLLILQFPLWWFSVPAIMKGWIDRVLANGVAYGAGKRIETGGLRGRSAMIATTTGCREEMMACDGLLGTAVILWPCSTAPRLLGAAGAATFVGWSIQYRPRQRGACLDAHEAHLRGIEHEAAMPSHPLSDFRPDWRLKPGIAPHRGPPPARRRGLSAAPPTAPASWTLVGQLTRQSWWRWRRAAPLRRGSAPAPGRGPGRMRCPSARGPAGRRAAACAA